MILRTTF